jgi:hypothetical protein
MGGTIYNPYQQASTSFLKQSGIRLPNADAYKFDTNSALPKTQMQNSAVTPTSTSSSIPPASVYQQYQMSDRDFNTMQKQNTFNNNIQMAGLGLSAITDGFNAWNQYKQLKLQKDQFKFNKNLETDKFALAKDAYFRSVDRANGIAEAYGGTPNKTKPTTRTA